MVDSLMTEKPSEVKENTEKTAAEKVHHVISPLKEMEHYSRTNIEKLSEHWLMLEDDLKNKALAAKMSDLLAVQNSFQDQVLALIGDLETEFENLEQKSAK